MQKTSSIASPSGSKGLSVGDGLRQGILKHRTTVKVVQNSGSILLYTTAVKVLKLVSFLLLARYLGISQFGKFSLVLAFVEIFRVMADFGVDKAVIRRLTVSDEDQTNLVGNTLTLKLILASASYLLALLGALVLGYPTDLVLLIGLAGLAFFASSCANALTTPFEAQLRMRRLVFAKISGGGFFILAVPIGMHLGLSLTGFLAIWVAAEFVTLFSTALVAKSCVKPKFLSNGKDLKDTFTQAVPLGITAVLTKAYFRVGTLILGCILGYQAVGEFAVVYRITESFLILAGAVASSLYPIFSRIAANGDFPRFKRAWWRAYGGSLLLGVFFAVIITVFAAHIVNLISAEYKGCISPLILMSWATVIMFANMQSATSIQGLGLFRLVALMASINLILNVSLNLYLVPLFAATGVALAALLTEGINMVIQLSFIFFLLKRRTMKDHGVSPYSPSLGAKTSRVQ